MRPRAPVLTLPFTPKVNTVPSGPTRALPHYNSTEHSTATSSPCLEILPSCTVVTSLVKKGFVSRTCQAHPGRSVAHQLARRKTSARETLLLLCHNRSIGHSHRSLVSFTKISSRKPCSRTAVFFDFWSHVQTKYGTLSVKHGGWGGVGWVK